jgi:hypothetical protein
MSACGPKLTFQLISAAFDPERTFGAAGTNTFCGVYLGITQHQHVFGIKVKSYVAGALVSLAGVHAGP